MSTAGRGHVHCYPYDMDDPTGPNRTNVQFLQFAKDAVTTGIPVRLMVLCIYVM